MFRLFRSRLGRIGGAAAAVALTRRLVREENAISLRGKVVMITGASTGLGLEMARECAAQGARLVICARTEQRLREAERDLMSRGAEVLAVVTDVSKRLEVAALVQQAVDRFGGIDVLICNAGVIQVGQYESMAIEQFESSMNGMFFGTLYAVHEALPHLEANEDGRIGIVASIGGKMSVPYLLPYNAAKFALVGLGEGLRAELAPTGVKVTTIIPGLTRTGSYLNAQFTGDDAGKQASYRWFSALSSLPGLTGDGTQAAEVYVGAVKRGDAEVMYPPQYQLVSRFHGVAPVLTGEILELTNRLLPPTGEPSDVVRGAEVEAGMEPGGLWKTLTAAGRAAAAKMQPGR